VAGAACVAGIVACGGGKESGAGAAGGDGGEGGSGSTFTIAMIAKSSTNPVFLSARTGAEAAAAELSKEHGVNVKINWLTPPSENAELQAQRIAQAVNSGSNAILVSASDAGKITGAINEAVDRADLDPSKVKIVSVDALPVELAYVDAGLTPVLLAQPTYLWGYESVKTIFDHVYLKKEVPAHIQMELVRVSKDNLGEWARQLQEWGYPDVDPKYIALE
jgi:ABC-type sugar transport system substrate-binding protein